MPRMTLVTPAIQRWIDEGRRDPEGLWARAAAELPHGEGIVAAGETAVQIVSQFGFVELFVRANWHGVGFVHEAEAASSASSMMARS